MYVCLYVVCVFLSLCVCMLFVCLYVCVFVGLKGRTLKVLYDLSVSMYAMIYTIQSVAVDIHLSELFIDPNNLEH